MYIYAYIYIYICIYIYHLAQPGAGGGGLAGAEEVGGRVEQREDVEALGVAEARVVLDQVGAARREHVAAVEDATVGLAQLEAWGGWGYYVLNRYSRIPGTQPHEYEYRIPPGEPCIRQEHVHIQGYVFIKRAESE